MELVVILPLAAVLAFGVFALVWTAARRRRIARHGVLRKATVTEVQMVPMSLEDTTSVWWRARYRYVDDGNVPHEGWSPLLTYDPTSRSSGNACEIRFDPSRPERSVWIEGTS